MFSLVAGVWIDRVRRRPVLLLANLGRAALIGVIPVAALLGVLRMELLYVVAFASGTLATCFESAYHAYLPTLIGRVRLIEGNSKLGVSESLASVVGPGLGGTLVQTLTAPIALAVDAVSFVVAAVAFWRIRTAEPATAAPSCEASFWSELRVGLGIVGRDPLLRATTASAATGNLFANVMYAVYVVYLARELALGPVAIGVIFSIGSFGGLLGALVAGPCSRWLGVGRTVIVAALMIGAGALLVPAATGPSMVEAAMLAAGRALIGLGAAISNVNVISLRAAVTPDHLLGRVDASVRVMTAGAMGVGPLIGGALGEIVGLWPTLLVGAVGTVLAAGWLIWSPVRSLREQPTLVAGPA
jgi:MFS family permease